MVKRYLVGSPVEIAVGCSIAVHEDTHVVVDISDYAALEDKCRELEAALNTWSDRCNCDCAACHQLANLVPQWKDCPSASETP